MKKLIMFVVLCISTMLNAQTSKIDSLFDSNTENAEVNNTISHVSESGFLYTMKRLFGLGVQIGYGYMKGEQKHYYNGNTGDIPTVNYKFNDGARCIRL